MTHVQCRACENGEVESFVHVLRGVWYCSFGCLVISCGCDVGVDDGYCWEWTVRREKK